MMRFLVVGCGGSGGHTMAYLMDQLRSDLRKDGVETLPAGWQFVFLDVPVAIQPGPEGVPNVKEQDPRAHYLGLGTYEGRYGVLDNALTGTLLDKHGLGAYGSWACRRPDNEETTISEGAGQYRAIGRAILLTKAEQIRKQLTQSYQLLSHDQTLREMAQVARATNQSFNDAKPPLVLVISSMAGGAGASMALDVCRLLSYVPDVDPSKIALFMVTPNVFDKLPDQARLGVRANALAMLGEIVASQAGAAQRHDVEMLRAAGVDESSNVRVPFARVFPVGSRVGLRQAEFGDGSKEVVYRGLARGLAGLMTSEVASDQFIAFDLGNRDYDPAKPELFGWGADPAPLPWGSFGFASISMGRDRYAEYAAQRLARACVDRLLDGHLDARGRTDRDRDGVDQAKSLLDTEWPGVSMRLGLPSALNGPQAAAELHRWYTGEAMPLPEVETSANRIVADELPLDNPYVAQASHWLEHVRRTLQARKATVVQRAEDEAYRLSVGWLQSLLDRVETEVADGVARNGLVYAGVLLERLQELLRSALIPGTDGLGQTPSGELTELPASVLTVVGAAGNGRIANGDELVRSALADARTKVGGQIYASSARHVSRGLIEFVTGVLTPLRREVADSYELLRDARTAELSREGLAQLETDQYAAWPSKADVRVPKRFGEANNEVLLTPSTEFGDQFRADVLTCLPVEERGLNPEEQVTTQVISGLWSTVGSTAPGGLLVRTAQWWPRQFLTDPATGRTMRSQDVGFALTIKPGQLRVRAMQFVQRPDASFDNFCSVSLRQYVLAENETVTDRERKRRETDMVDSLRAALRLALPLISVDGEAVGKLHDAEVAYRYKFSHIPLDSPGSNIVEELRAVLADRNFHASSRTNFDEALKDSGNPRRIDIFGSYPLFAPLAFNAVLDPVIEQWETTPPKGRRQFWTMRRSRTLDASLPMGDEERRAMVAGWYVGNIIGAIKRPAEPYAAPVQIWDPQADSWAPFPYPMLTPPASFRHKQDWLPAVLESSLLAVARAHRGVPMSSLKPYRLLRDLYDDLPEGGRADRNIDMAPLSAERILRTWLRNGPRLGLVSDVPSIAKADDMASRYETAHTWVTGERGPSQLVRRYKLADRYGQGGWVVGTRLDASGMPALSDLAPDMELMLGKVDELLRRAYRRLQAEPEGFDDGPVELPDDPDVEAG